MKKLLLSLGALATVVAPVAAVVACSSTDDDADKTTPPKTDTNKDGGKTAPTTDTNQDGDKTGGVKTAPGATGVFKLDSTKTVAQLKAIDPASFKDQNPKQMGAILGTKNEFGITLAGNDAKWDPATLTLSAKDASVKTKFTITPTITTLTAADLTTINDAVTVTGISAYATIAKDDTKDLPDGVASIALPADVSTALANTDKVNLDVTYEDGYTGPTTFEFTVSGLDEIVPVQISQDDITKVVDSTLSRLTPEQVTKFKDKISKIAPDPTNGPTDLQNVIRDVMKAMIEYEIKITKDTDTPQTFTTALSGVTTMIPTIINLPA